MSRQSPAPHRARNVYGLRTFCATALLGAALPAVPAAADSPAADPTLSVSSPAALDAAPATAAAVLTLPPFEARSLDGGGNNLVHPSWGQSGTEYSRVAPASYADGKNAQGGGPPPRYTSNRVFNDTGQNIFSERNVSQWGWTWGQFMDHVFGLAQGGGEASPIPFNSGDPLESFRNDIGTISFTRDAPAPGSGTSTANPREHINTLSSYIDAFNVYGGTADRLEWLRRGPVDADMSNNGPRLMMTANDYLPRATARDDAASAPVMATDGQLAGHPQDRAVAGDVRANENMALTATHTLFAREHNRIVDALAASGLGAERKFQIARRVVGAEQQFVTYNEFLPAMGVPLPPYTGYKPGVDSTLSTEFATVSYRAHSQIHGEFEIDAEAADYTTARLNRLRNMGVEVTVTGTEVAFVVPLNVAFFNPDLVNLIGEGPIMKGLNGEPQYKNDEQIDNALRSVLFRLPGPGAPDPGACFTNPAAVGCFDGVTDLGAIDIQRGRDHGVPKYNALRMAYGLQPKTSFVGITGEGTAAFPSGVTGINDPRILDFLALFDANGNPVPIGSEAGAIRGVRRTTLAARLKAIYGASNFDDVEAFVGAYSEPHVQGSEMGQLNRAVWSKQFAALRDGDRFFYGNDAVLPLIEQLYGITYRHTLSELIALNTDIPAADLPANLFFAP
jgi:hypothetical protein